MSDRKEHENEERTVKCPVEGCDSEALARGVHLHVRQSADDAHGPRGTVPDHIDFDDLETVGSESVTMEYPTKRDTDDNVARLCPYCAKPFRGTSGVQIHLGQVEGKGNHPEDASDHRSLNSYPKVTVDEDDYSGGVIEVDHSAVENSQTGPVVPVTRIYQYIVDLLEDGRTEDAQTARQRLLGPDAVTDGTSPIFDALVLVGRAGTIKRGISIVPEDDTVRVSCRGVSDALSPDEARLVARQVEEAAGFEDWLDEDTRHLIEFLLDCADYLDGNLSEEQLLTRHESEGW